ncbi:MAG: hypothetical protein MI725_16200, partial [Pirellulales bacterium]|nr:hypothetical protein [Pirellulales bacterium]
GFSAMTKTIVAMTPKPAEKYSTQEAAEVEQAQQLAELRSRDFRSLSVGEKEELERLAALRPRQSVSYLREDYLVWMVALIVLVYAIAGGLEAAFYTEMLQGVFIILLSIALIPFAWAKINNLYGGSGPLDALATIHAKLPEHFFDIFGSPKVVDFTWYYVLAASCVAGITVVAQPNQMVTNAAAKDELSARLGFVTGVFVKRLCTILWGMLGLAAILLYTGKVQNPDLVWGFAARDLLGPGLVGLMIASMMAALMSTADMLMLTCSGLLLRNFYRPLFPGQTEVHYVWAGRVLGGIVLFGGAMLATRFTDILQIIKFIIEFFVVFAAAFWLGVKWRRAHVTAAWTSILSTLLIFYLLPLIIPCAFPTLRTSEELTKRTSPTPIRNTYRAVELDVEQRAQEIVAWDHQNVELPTDKPRPEPLTVGQTFVKVSPLPRRGIFWSQGVQTNQEGVLVGSGYLFPELVLLDALGMDLTENPHALNESLRLMIRLVFPFMVLIVVSFALPPEDDVSIDRFFIKMRTDVQLGSQADARHLAQAYEDPTRLDRQLLFPKTAWEIYRWNRTDALGFCGSVAFVFVVLGIMFIAVNAGG